MPIAALPGVVASLSGFRKALLFALCGGVGAVTGDVIFELFHDLGDGDRSFVEHIINVAVWFGLVGAGISAAILAGQRHYLRCGISVDADLLVGAGFGAAAGAVAGGIAQAIYASGGEGEVLRATCWMIAGGLVGFALSFRIPNLGPLRGAGGGLAGGLLGGILFIAIVVMMLNDLPARIVGTFAIGFFIGLMIVFAEMLFREAWLEVAYGPKEMRTVTLGVEPVSLGSDASACTVYIAGISPKALSYRFVHGQIVVEDLATGARSTVKPGDVRSFGRATVMVRGLAEPAPPQPATTTELSPPATPPPPWSAVSRVPASALLSLSIEGAAPIPMMMGVTVRAVELGGTFASEPNREIAVVNSNPADPAILGLRNLSDLTWEVTLPGALPRHIEPGQTIRLQRGTRLVIGRARGEIR